MTTRSATGWKALFARTDVQLLLLVLQLTIYVLRIIYASGTSEPIAYQRF